MAYIYKHFRQNNNDASHDVCGKKSIHIQYMNLNDLDSLAWVFVFQYI